MTFAKPEYLVETDDGKQAAHKASALRASRSRAPT